MKKRFSVLIAILLVCLSVGLVGCSKNANTTDDPFSAIKQQYGTKEFTISFSSENLSAPVSDMVYTAYEMPKLPTPERVGYIFEGWYYDKAYSLPYTENSLYLYMTDVTLYAKWSKEDFVNDGTYDIEIKAEIVEGSVTLGSLAEQYGWKNFAEDIVLDETYIEKTENGLQFKLTYNNGTTAPYGQSATYRIVPSVSMGSSIYQTESIVPDNETVHSRFYNIDKFDITNPIYLDVTAINWESGLSSTEAMDTIATYTVKLTVSRLIGFSKSYIDPDVAADPGYYLIKTHFIKEDGTSSMLESYNSVYSYVRVDEDGNYTLIKPFNPYAGMVASIDNKTLSHYYSRNMTFAPTQLYYEIVTPENSGTEVSADYFPEYYNAGYYGNYTVEFHADTGRYYQIFNLGKSFKRAFVIKGATTGFMEQAFAMGAYNSIMTLDYEHIVKISEMDYTPLSGSNYSYGDNIEYYAGKLDDLNAQNLTKNALEKNGVANEMINLFYSAASMNAATSERTMHSFSMTVTPTAATNSATVKDSRYKIADFNLNYKVYGYDPATGANLYADSMTATYFGTNGSARRENVQILNGKAVNSGDKIWLNTLYKEKVNVNEEFGGKNVTIYSLKADGKVDFASGKSVNVNTAYTFNGNVAVEYKDGDTVALVYLKQYSAPVCNVINTESNTYSEYGHTIGDTISFPIVRYTFMGNSGGFIDEYYPNEEHNMVADPTRVALYSVDGDTYKLIYLTGTLTFTMESSHMVVAYECRNEFGEISMYYLHFYAESQTKYSLTEDGEEISNGTVRYYTTGERQPIQIYTSEGHRLLSYADLTQLALKKYLITFGSTVIPLNVESCYLYANGTYQVFTTDIFNQLKEATKNSDYFVFTLRYTNGSDVYRVSYQYGLKFDGKESFEFITDDDTFTGYDYILKCPKVVSADGTVLGTGTLDIRKFSNGGYFNAAGSVKLTRYGDSYQLTFNSTGKYQILFTVKLTYDEDGNRLFGGESVTLTFSQYVEVIDGKGDITITYVTDKDHPFADGIPYEEITDGKGNVIGYAYKITYNLASTILTMAQQDGSVGNFIAGNDRLFGWLKREDYTLLDASTALRRGTIIDDYIGTFGKREVTLYALWDKGLTINIDRAESITGYKPQIITKWLSTTTNNYGEYSFVVNSLTFDAPTGYIHKGWMINGVFYEVGSLTTLRYKSDTMVEVKVVLAKQYTVRYIINSTYANRIGDSQVEEGSTIQLPNVTAKDGYTFKGWKLVTSYMTNSDYTVGDEAIDGSTIINDENALCQVNGRQAIVLVAVFTDSEGNEVW